jgi:hypothetical protein
LLFWLSTLSNCVKDFTDSFAYCSLSENFSIAALSLLALGYFSEAATVLISMIFPAELPDFCHSRLPPLSSLPRWFLKKICRAALTLDKIPPVLPSRSFPSADRSFSLLYAVPRPPPSLPAGAPWCLLLCSTELLPEASIPSHGVSFLLLCAPLPTLGARSSVLAARACLPGRVRCSPPLSISLPPSFPASRYFSAPDLEPLPWRFASPAAFSFL